MSVTLPNPSTKSCWMVLLTTPKKSLNIPTMLPNWYVQGHKCKYKHLLDGFANHLKKALLYPQC